MCVDDENPNVRGAYSIGISGSDKWSTDISTYFSNIPVALLDCTIAGYKDACDSCTFYQTCVKSEDNVEALAHKDNKDMHAILQMLDAASAADRSLWMKMDIEGAEWSALASMTTAELFKFSQIVVEFHGIDKEERHGIFLETMKNVFSRGNFVIAHTHGNNNDGAVSFDNKWSIPSVIEVTLVPAEQYTSNTCESYAGTTLDKANIPGRQDVVAPKLPNYVKNTQ